MILLLYLLFFSLLFLPIKKEKNKIVTKVVIKWLNKYHYSNFRCKFLRLIHLKIKISNFSNLTFYNDINMSSKVIQKPKNLKIIKQILINKN